MPAGRPRPEAEEGEAYHVWCTMPNKNGHKWLVQLSQTTGISKWRLKDWRKRYEWDRRWLEDTHQAKTHYFRIGEAVLLDYLRPMLERQGEIAVHGSDRDATQAAKLLAAIIGIDQSGGSVHITNVDKQLVVDAKQMSLAELRNAAITAGQGNMDAVATQRMNKQAVKQKGLTR